MSTLYCDQINGFYYLVGFYLSAQVKVNRAVLVQTHEESVLFAFKEILYLFICSISVFLWRTATQFSSLIKVEPLDKMRTMG